MSNVLTQIIKDLRKIEADFAKVERAVVRRAFRNVMNKAGTPVVREIKSQAPFLTGSLKKTIKKRVWINASKSTGGVVSGIDDRKTFSNSRTGAKIWPKKYLHLVEQGTKAHKAGARAHPGATANPFMARAANIAKPKAEKIVIDGLDAAIKKAVAQLT